MFLAVYGALLSSVTFGWNLLRDQRDRAKLKLTANVRKFVIGTDGKWFAVSPDFEAQAVDEHLYVVLSVVNVGRRPIQWQGWGGKYYEPVNGKKGFNIIGRDLPRMLNEYESHQEFTPLMNDLRPVNENVRKLYMWDASGKEWTLSRRQLKRLRHQATVFSQSGC